MFFLPFTFKGKKERFCTLSNNLFGTKSFVDDKWLEITIDMCRMKYFLNDRPAGDHHYSTLLT